MKTEKFSIQTYASDIALTTEISLSKKEYYKNLHLLQNEVELSKEKTEFITTEHKTEYEGIMAIAECTRFTNGNTDVYLTHYKCKEGYQFK